MRQCTLPAPVPVITLTAASLPLGGLFDFRNANWLPPHLSYRFGNDVDMRINNLTNAQRLVLERAVNAAGFGMPVPSESPDTPDASHWHLRL